MRQGATVLDMGHQCEPSEIQAMSMRWRQDIAEVVQATPGAEHKVILETCYLTDQEKITACRLVVEARADYAKTSTGFGAGGATVADVRLMKEAVGANAKVKASGGIRDWKTAMDMLEARSRSDRNQRESQDFGGMGRGQKKGIGEHVAA